MLKELAVWAVREAHRTANPSVVVAIENADLARIELLLRIAGSAAHLGMTVDYKVDIMPLSAAGISALRKMGITVPVADPYESPNGSPQESPINVVAVNIPKAE